MSRVKTLALAVAVLFALAGCAKLFEFNLFGKLDSPPTPTLEDYEGSDGLDQLDEDLDSPAIVEKLAADPELVDDIMSLIANEFLGGDPPTSCADEEAAQAAIVYADLALKTAEGEDLVNNLADTIVAMLRGETPGGSTVADILAGIIPAEARADAEVFADMIRALLMANDAYILLGDYIDGATSDGTAERNLPPGSLPGDVAQKAIVAYTMRATVDAVITGLGLVGTQEEKEALAIAELFKVATGQASGAAGLAVDAFATPIDPVKLDQQYAILALVDLAGITL